MKRINEDIANNKYEKVYLLTGDEAYLRLQARNNLKKALCGEGDTLNVAFFSGKDTNQPEIIDFANTIPFLAEKRVVFIEESNIFSEATDDFIDFIGAIPETTVMIFVQTEVDKRTRLYKAIKANGRVTELVTPTVASLEAWTIKRVSAAGLKLTRASLSQLFQQVGTKDMVRLEQEIDKLICYCINRGTITADDVKAICMVSVEDKVFDMVEAMAYKNRRRAMEVYNDLLTLKVSPVKTLSIITGYFRNMYAVKDMYDHNIPLDTICSQLNRRDFAVEKLKKQANNYTYEQLKTAITDCIDLDYDFKNGLIEDKLAVELIICKYS